MRGTKEKDKVYSVTMGYIREYVRSEFKVAFILTRSRTVNAKSVSVRY